MKRNRVYATPIVAISLAIGTGTAQALTSQEELGESIFFDISLSINGNQACAACHGPEVGFTGPESDINVGGAVYEGSITGRFGNRKPPSAAYATPSPILHYTLEKANNKNKTDALFVGGNFWDGRATGEKLGNPAADQAQGPFLNPLEQALPDPAAVISRICGSAYTTLFTSVCGVDACDAGNVKFAYDCVGLSVAAYEGSSEVNQFSSKYDAYLAGAADLTKEEKHGSEPLQVKG